MPQLIGAARTLALATAESGERHYLYIQSAAGLHICFLFDPYGALPTGYAAHYARGSTVPRVL